MSIFNLNVEKMTELQAKEALEIIIDKLDELDDDDFFGSEGWKHLFDLED